MVNEQLVSAVACNRDVLNDKPSAKQDCSDVINISIFFDGTGNNDEKDERNSNWSNVSRLYRSARQLVKKDRLITRSTSPA